MRGVFCWVLILFLASLPVSIARDFESSVDRLLARSIPLISTSELADELEAGAAVVLLDARHHKEFLVSHLSGARRVGFLDFQRGRVEAIDKDAAIVVYCSIGYRSEKIGEKLVAAGFSNVRNLYGGIFAWANEGRPLLDADEKATAVVHGFSAKWSELLLPAVPSVVE